MLHVALSVFVKTKRDYADYRIMRRLAVRHDVDINKSSF